MRKRLAWIACGALLGNVAGCSLLGGGGSETVVPRPRAAADDEQPAPESAKTSPPQAVATGNEKQAPKPEEPRQVDSEQHRRTLVINKLRILAQAFESYQRGAEQYPSPAAAGQLSWRVALLPMLGQRPLYEKFHLNEPWNSEHNLPLLKQMPDAYQSVERRDEKTNFLLVTGPGTACPARAGLTSERCPDGVQNTLILAEVADPLAKPWTQPEDFVFDRATAQQDLFGLRKDCCLVVLGAPMGVRRLPVTVSDNDLLALLSPAGREPVLGSAVTKYADPEVDAELIAKLERNPLKRFVPAPAGKEGTTTKEGSTAGTASGSAPFGSKAPPSKSEPPPPKDSRLPVPDDKALAAATATAKELYKADYETAKKPGGKRALAKKLLGLAGQVISDPPGMFVLLRDARDLAAPAGDIDTAVAAADKLGQTFRLDPLPLKVKSMEQAAPTVETLAEAGKLFTKSLDLETELLEHNDFDGAKRCLAVAMNAARRSGKRDPVDQVTARREKVDDLKRAFDRVSGALLTLVRSPDDPSANAAVGKYLCLVRENWARGLPLLARGDDGQLSELAAADLKNPTAVEEQVILADRWWEQSQKLSSVERAGSRLRAAHWYKQALPGLPASLTSQRIKQRVADAEKEGGPRPKPAGNAAKGRSSAAG